MTDGEIRVLISEAMQYASVPDFNGSQKQAAFLQGDQDILFDEFEIDSLASMELCIAIEAELGVSITPAELPQIASLGNLVRRIREEMGA